MSDEARIVDDSKETPATLGLFGSVKARYHKSRDEKAAGIDLTTQAELASCPLDDREIPAASDQYFSMLATLTHSLDAIAKWRSGILELTNTLQYCGDLYNTTFPPGSPLSGQVAGLIQATSNLRTAQETLLEAELSQILNDTLNPLKGQLAAINQLRSKALRVQYRYEQLQKVGAEPDGQKVLGVIGKDWTQKAQDELNVVKPAFLNEVETFRGTFESLRSQAFERIERLHQQLFERVGLVEPQVDGPKLPEAPEYADLLEVTSVYVPKV
jgi:hypothetical protein